MQTLANHKPYRDAVLEEEFSKFESETHSHVLHHARADAACGQPDSIESYEGLIGRYIYGQTQKMIFYGASRLQVQTNAFGAKQLDRGAFSETAPLHARQAEIDIAVDKVERELEQLRPSPSEVLERKLTLAGLALAGGLEAVMSYAGLRHSGLSTKGALATTVLIGVVMFIGCEFLAEWIQKAQEGKRRLGRYYVVTAVAALVFFQLARLRILGSEQHVLGFSVIPERTPSLYGAIAIWVISLSVFVIALVASVRTRPTKAERHARDLYKQRLTEVSKLVAERATLARQIQEIEQETAAARIEAIGKHEFSLVFFKNCINAAEALKGLYISTVARAGRSKILEFAQDIPPMAFEFFPNHQNHNAQ